MHMINLCARKLGTSGSVYHCPGARNQSHPRGFDMCTNCAETKVPVCMFVL